VFVRPTRVALVGPFWPYRGGIAHFSRALAAGLAARGHDVRRYTFARQYPERLFPGKTQLEAGLPPAAEQPPAPRLLDTLDPRTWTRTARVIAEDGAEVVVLAYWMPFFAPVLGVLARRLRRRGVRVLAVVHNALPHERRPGDRLLTRFALGACDGLVVLSEGVRRDVEALVPGVPVRQAAHPVYDLFGAPVPKAEARAALGLPADAPLLLFFGFVRRYKGLHVLLDAMPRILARLPDARLVVAGEFYADEDALRAQAAPLGAAVRFDADYVPDEAVARYFGAADVVVQPYVSATQSGVAQIAFHFGRPVITTDVGGLAEVVPHGEAGLVVPPEDPEALAGAVVRFFEEGMAARLEAGVRREREEYGWDRLFEALEALWEAGPEPAAL